MPINQEGSIGDGGIDQFGNIVQFGGLDIGSGTSPPPPPANGYVTEDGLIYYVAEDGSTYYVQE